MKEPYYIIIFHGVGRIPELLMRNEFDGVMIFDTHQKAGEAGERLLKSMGKEMRFRVVELED